MQSVLTTSFFEADAKAAGLDEEEITVMVVAISENPMMGVVVPGTGGARKVRFAGKGGGKSGGYRTIHYFGGADIPVFLLSLIDKGQKANLSKAEQNGLRDELSRLADDYRDGVTAKIAQMKRRR